MASPPRRVAIYARVSTPEQAKKHGTAYQTDLLRAYATQRGWVVEAEFTDEGFSGRKDSRPGLDALMDGARKGRFDVVAVWRFDRFARSVVHLVKALEEFKARGVEFVSYQENIDTATPLGRALFTIAAAFAELEADAARERVAAGMARAKRRGTVIGRKRADVAPQTVVDAVRSFGGVRPAARSLGLSVGLVQRRLREARATAPAV